MAKPGRPSRPLLQGIAGFLDEQAPLVDHVRQDLVRGRKNPNTGRNGITPAQTRHNLSSLQMKIQGGEVRPHSLDNSFIFNGFATETS